MKNFTSWGYNYWSGTLANGASDTSLGMTKAYNNVTIINKSTGDLKIKFNKKTNDTITVDNTYVSPLEISDMDLNQVYMTNDSGGNIEYIIIATGT